MTVFKGYMLMAKRNIKTIIVYFVVFLGITIAMGNSKNGNLDDFSATKIDIAVVDADNSELSKKVVDYLKENHNVTMQKNDNSLLQEELYYQKIKLAVRIKKNFEKDAIAGKSGGIEYTQNPGEYCGSYIESQLTQIVQNTLQYHSMGYSIAESYDKVQTQKFSEVVLEDINGNGGQEPGYGGYFRFLPYLTLAVLCTVLGTLLVVFRERNVKKRMMASKVSLFRQNVESISAFILIGIVMYVLVIAIGLLIYQNNLLQSTNLVYYLVNGFLVMLTTLAISFIIGLLVKKKKYVDLIVTPVSLMFSFLCGVFVPLSLLPASIKIVSRFLPIYWYEYVNEILLAHADITGSVKNQVMTGFGLQILFVLALVGAGMAIAKYQQQER